MGERPTIYGANGQAISSRRSAATGYGGGGASLTRRAFDDWDWAGGSVDDDITAHLPVLRQRGRALGFTAPNVGGQYVSRTTFAVGSGLIPVPTPDIDYLGWTQDQAKKWIQQAERVWAIHAESPKCDYYGMNNFYELTQVVSYASDESGDIFSLLPRSKHYNEPFDIKIQLVEADCCADPDGMEATEYRRQGYDIYGGVVKDQHGRVAGYMFFTGDSPMARRQPNALGIDPLKPRWVFVPKYLPETGLPAVLHMFVARRPRQTRGVPLAAQYMEIAMMLDKFVRAYVTSAHIESLFSVLVKTQTPDATAEDWQSLYDADGADKKANERYPDVVLGSGNVQHLNIDEAVDTVQSSKPGPQFAPFVEALIQMQGGISGVPYEMQMGRYDNSYSSSRAANNFGNVHFKIKRHQLITQFCKPYREQWMDEAVVKGYIDAPGYFDDALARVAYNRHKWIGPAMPEIDRQKSMMGAVLAAAHGYITNEEATAELSGGNYFENLEARKREIDAAKAAGLTADETQGADGTQKINPETQVLMTNMLLAEIAEYMESQKGG